MKELFTLYYHRRILFTDFFSQSRDSGHAIENVVYFELLRRDYDVSIGKVDNSEVDFIATKVDDKLYVQVTESMYINTPVPVARKKLSNIRCID